MQFCRLNHNEIEIQIKNIIDAVSVLQIKLLYFFSTVNKDIFYKQKSIINKFLLKSRTQITIVRVKKNSQNGLFK